MLSHRFPTNINIVVRVREIFFSQTLLITMTSPHGQPSTLLCLVQCGKAWLFLKLHSDREEEAGQRCDQVSVTSQNIQGKGCAVDGRESCVNGGGLDFRSNCRYSVRFEACGGRHTCRISVNMA